MMISALSAEEELVQVLPLLLLKIHQEASTIREAPPGMLRELLGALDIAWVAAQRLKLERDDQVIDWL